MNSLKRILILGLVLAAACSTLGSSINVPVARADVEREANPPTDDVAALVAGNTAFAFDLYHQIVKEQDGNLIFSPYSISTALAMVYAGARGDTAAQMAQTLHYTLPPEQLHPAFNALNRILQPPEAENVTPIPTNEYYNPAQELTLHIANGLWGQTGFPFEDAFLQTLTQDYGTELNQVDFSQDVEGARQIMRQWVEDNTGGHIKDMPPPGSITPATQLALANAVYFKAQWANPFSMDKTRDAPFHLEGDGDVTVPMMVNPAAEKACGRGEGYTAIQLTYGYSEKAAMMILLPDAGQFKDFENRLDSVLFQQIHGGMSNTNSLTFNMPRFKFESDIDLLQSLSAMGMNAPFSDGANFSGMSSNSGLHIDFAQHKATIAVDEQGTEASGVTFMLEMLLQPSLLSSCGDSVTADRPFIFAIYDTKTGTILFLGRVMNPAA
ncbi:MAG: serpin family protein [Chloroflexota bacterium]